MKKHLKVSSILLAIAALLLTSCGLSHNKIRYGNKKVESHQTTLADDRLDESPDKHLLSDQMFDANESIPLNAKPIKTIKTVIAPLIHTEMEEHEGRKLILTADEEKTQERKFKIGGEVPLEKLAIQNDEEEPRYVRIKKTGKLLMLISLGSMSLTFVFLVLGFAGAITSPALGLLMGTFAIAAVFFLLLALSWLIAAAVAKHKANKVEQ